MNYPALIAWLLAQIDDDLLWAVEASRKDTGREAVPSGVHWQWINPDDDTVAPILPDVEQFVGEEAGGGVALHSVEHWPYRDMPEDSEGLPQFALYHVDEVPVAVGGHIVRHDPARVIRDLTARRRSVLLCGENLSLKLADAILRDMAETYCERPGYLPEWKPKGEGR